MLPYQIAPTNGDPSHDGVRDPILPPLANPLPPPRRHAEGRTIETTAKKHKNRQPGMNLQVPTTATTKRRRQRHRRI